jgi:hypothetical protein
VSDNNDARDHAFDEEIEEEVTVSRRWLKWEKPGDTVVGVALKLETSRKYGKDNKILHMLDDEGEKFLISSPMTLTTKIEEGKLFGKRLQIIFDREEKKGKNKLKHFKVGITKKQPDPSELPDDFPF